MKGVPQGRYTKEFREEAVKLVTEESISLPEATGSSLHQLYVHRFQIRLHRKHPCHTP